MNASPNESRSAAGSSNGTSRHRRLTISGLVTLGLAAGGGVAATAQAASGGSGSGSTSGSPTTSTAPAPPGRPAATPGRPAGRSKYDIDGLITSASRASLSVRDLFGTTRTYAITSKTVIHSGPASRSGTPTLAAGEHVHVRGEHTASGMSADDIDIHLAHVDGRVKTSSGDTVTVTDPDGFTRTLQLSASTTFTRDGKTTGRSSVVAGRVVHAEGSVDGNGTSLDATRVDIRTSDAFPAGPGRHKGGPAGNRPAAPPAPASGQPGKPGPASGQPGKPGPASGQPGKPGPASGQPGKRGPATGQPSKPGSAPVSGSSSHGS